MKSETCRKLEMAGSALAFCRNNPIPADPGHAVVVARLEERLDRALAMARQELQGHQRVEASAEHKEALRWEIREALLVIAGIARAASDEHAGLSGLGVMPPVRIAALDLVAVARTMLTLASREREKLLQFGLPVRLLEELALRIERFEGAVSEKQRAVLAHVGASAELAAVGKDIIRVVRQLDALHRHYFSKDPERRAGWKSARNVKWPRARHLADEPTSTT